MDETTIDFIERFRMLNSKCKVQPPGVEYVTMAVSNIHPQLREMLLTKYCPNLNLLTSKASRIEQIITKKQKGESNWEMKPYLDSTKKYDKLG